MNLSKTILAMMLVVLWAPITSHCLLERGFGLEYLACSSDDAAGGESNSDADGCQSVELASYRIEETQPLVFGFLRAIALCAPVPVFDRPPGKPPSLAFSTETLPEILSAWRFAFRAALPIRPPPMAS